MKKVILFTLSVICVMLFMSGCGDSNELVGVWAEVDGDGILYFSEDNTGLSANVVYTSESFEYEAKDEKLTFIAESTVETEYTVDKNTLTITVDGTDYLYKLVELSESEIDKYLADNGIDTENLPKGNKKDTDSDSDTMTDDIPEKDNTSEQNNTPEQELSDEKISESIVGAWRGGDDSISLVYIFNDDGTGVAALFPFTYTVKDGVISIEMEAFGEVETGSARYEVEGDCLYIENDDGVYLLQRTEIPEELKEKLN